MAYGKSNLPFLIKEGFVEIGIWTNPNALTPATDPNTAFTSSGDLGYFKQGSSKTDITRSYATFLAGTPGKKVRKDLVLKEFTLTFMLAQFNQDLLALAQGLDVDTGAYDIAWIGNDEPTQTFNGYRVTTALTDATPYYVAMWYGKNTSEQVGWALSGTEHGTFELKLEAFEHPSFTIPANVNDEHNYGAIFFDNGTTA